jgi:outer membrane protein assembly factor BamB
MNNDLSRRGFLAVSGLVLAGGRAAAVEGKDSLPVVPKRVEKAFKAPGKMPNALQAMPDGLWIQTESIHGSGITYGNGALWIGSTWSLKTLKVDPKTGKTLKSFDTPGAGMNKFGKPTRPSGAHGLEWVDGKYWMAVPASDKIYQIEPESGKILHSIPAPGTRTHGLAWDNGYLWCVESTDRAIYKMDPKDGKLLAKIQLTKADPEPHGFTMTRSGAMWYCDATSKENSGWVCRLV